MIPSMSPVVQLNENTRWYTQLGCTLNIAVLTMLATECEFPLRLNLIADKLSAVLYCSRRSGLS